MIDYIRCFLYLAIASFHFVSIVWIDKGYAFSSVTSLWNVTEQYARTFVYSGQIILALTFALMAFRADSAKKLKRIIMGSAVAAVLMAVADYPDNHSLFIWDIYPLVFAGALSLYLSIKYAPRLLDPLAVVGLMLLQLSFWDILPFTNTSIEVRAALVGDCVQKFADWPLLPWLGLIWFSFGVGKVAYSHQQKLKAFHRIEIGPSLLILLLGIWHFNAYRNTPPDAGWACFVFRQAPEVFLSQLFLYLLLMRLSLLDSVQIFLENFRLTKNIQSLRFTRNFGLFYLVHYLLMAGAFYFFGKHFVNEPHISFAVFILLPVVAELALRLWFTIQSKSKA